MTIASRLWLPASIVASIAYYLLRDSGIDALATVGLKGLPVALLAAHALAGGRRPLALVMAFGALGDVLIEFRLEAGALAFFAGHLVAMNLYLRYRRDHVAWIDKGVAVALIGLTPAIAWSLAGGAAASYALALGGMAACAWMSGFSRARVSLGALLFVDSDLLIFARIGPLAGSALPGLLIWPLYYIGQLLICTGVIAGPAKAGDRLP